MSLRQAPSKFKVALEAGECAFAKATGLPTLRSLKATVGTHAHSTEEIELSRSGPVTNPERA
eukprot:95733-Prymnesium_polylepis.1